jgi:hypothetical protein
LAFSLFTCGALGGLCGGLALSFFASGALRGFGGGPAFGFLERGSALSRFLCRACGISFSLRGGCLLGSGFGFRRPGWLHIGCVSQSGENDE